MPPDEPTAAPDVSQLRPRTLPDGTKVYSGPLAEQALDAVGARAMTLDHTILVRGDLDPSNPEDLALVAHEQHHVDASGGAAAHEENDAEEAAARAVESFVLHQRQAEEAGEEPVSGDAPFAAVDTPGSGDPMAGYRAMLAQGTPHDMIVDQLARGVLDELRRVRGTDVFRGRRGP